jgi:hypothetical protein
MTDRKRRKNETGLGSTSTSTGAAMRRSGLVDFSADTEEAESSLSDGFGLSQERGRLRGGAAFSLLASVDMVDATQCDGRRLEKGETDGRSLTHLRDVSCQYFNSLESAHLTLLTPPAKECPC